MPNSNVKKELTVADVAQLPKELMCCPLKTNGGRLIKYPYDYNSGYNEALKEISQLPLSTEKVVGMVTIQEECFEDLYKLCPNCGGQKYTVYMDSENCPAQEQCQWCWELHGKLSLIISNKSKLLRLKGKETLKCQRKM